ncbi:MAG TPA: hypothetical protein VGR81_07920 [Candidatus Acidoferrales bacterium]|nr:hypothetical protein [Candidatus Acidoferrales bacterium]
MDKTQLLNVYSGLRSEIPQWKAQAQKFAPDVNGTYATALRIMKRDLLKTLNDLTKTLDNAKDEEFANQSDVAFVECRVKDDLGDIAETFDTQNVAEGSSGSASEGLVARMFEDASTIGPYQRTLRIDLENRLREMALLSSKSH